MLPTKFTLPTLRKLCKKGTNTVVLDWLEAYGKTWYKRGVEDGMQALKRKLEGEITDTSNDNGGEWGEPQGGESDQGGGVNADDSDCGGGSPEKTQDDTPNPGPIQSEG